MSDVKPNSAAGQPEKKIRPPDEEKKTDPCLVLNDELRVFLNLTRLPAYLNEAQTAALLGLKRDHIPILAAYGFLKPMGEPAPNGEKLYARVRVLKNAENEEWLSRAKAVLSDHWRKKNARKAKGSNST